MSAFGRNRTLRDGCYFSVYKVVRLEFSLTIFVDLSSKLASSDDKNSNVAELSHENCEDRAEVSHEPTRQRERAMRGFNSPTQAQRFLTLHGLTQNLFRVGRHLLQTVNYRILRTQTFQIWQEAVCA